MKFIRITLLFVLISLASCTHEGYRDCPCDVRLTFSLKDKTGNEVFSQHIKNTDLVIFNEAGEYCGWYQLDQNQLNSLCGLELSLIPGNYSIATWGNIGSYTSLCNVYSINTCDDGNLMFTGSDSCDPIYYAPAGSSTRTSNPEKKLYTFTVPQNTVTVEHTVEFTHAHNKLNIYVQGFDDNGNTEPIVELENHKGGYDFYMNHLSVPFVNYQKTSVNTTTPSGIMACAPFTTSRLRRDTPININIKKPSNSATIYTVALSEILESVSDADLQVEVTIPIVITFVGATVKVTLPKWTVEPSKPEID